MKKVVLAVVLGLALAFISYGVCWAGPFLVCDPYKTSDNVTKFVVSMDTAAPVDSLPVNNALRFDLAILADGAHTVKVKACNAFLCSGDSAPFTFIKAVPGVPLNITIISQ